jgi:PAS domain S-box-containing protein
VIGRGSAGLIPVGLFVSVMAWAETPPPSFRQLSIPDGLSDGHVRTIVQDGRGFLWFGTIDGLNRYDGYQLRVFRHESDNARSLASNFVRALYVDRSGTLWVGTVGGGLDRFEPLTEDFVHYRDDPKDPESLGADDVHSIAQDRSGALWIATSRGLDRMDPSTGRFRHYRHDAGNPESLSHDDVYAVLEDARGALWVGTNGGGLDRGVLGSEPLRFVHYRHDPGDEDSVSSDLVQVLHEAKSGALWIGTWGGGLNRLLPGRDAFERYQSPGLPSPNVWTIREDRGGTLWVGTGGGGLVHLDPSGEIREVYRNDPAVPSSLAHDNVTSVYEDREGLLWIGTGGSGVSVLDRARKPFDPLPFSSSNRPAGGFRDVRAIHEDHEGNLWIGTGGQGLFGVPPEGGPPRNYRYRPGDRGSLSNDIVLSIAEDSRGVLWIGTMGGLNELDVARERFRRYHHDTADDSSVSDDLIATLLADPDTGSIWVGTSTGLNRLDPRKGTFQHYPREEEDGSIAPQGGMLILLKDATGGLWLDESPGLFRFDPTTGRFRGYRLGSETTASGTPVYAARQDERGRLWLAAASGLLSLDPESGEVTRFGGDDPSTPLAALTAILEDDEGRFWLASTQGLYRFDPRTKRFRRYDLEEIGLRQALSQGACRSRTGRFYFGGADGLVTFDPSKIEDVAFAPPVVLTRLELANRAVPIGPESVLKQSITETARLTLGPRDRIFSLEFAALSYRAPFRNRYRYRLEGFDRDWTEVDGRRRLATYTNLAPGHYVFRVSGSNNDGFWSETGATLAIDVLPSWWQTGWFIGSTVLVGTLLVFGAQRLQVRSLVRRARELAREVESRLRTEAALREQEETNRGVLESLKSAIALLDGEGRITTVNESWKSLFPEGLVGADYVAVLRETIDSGAERAAEVATGIQSVLEGRTASWEVEIPSRTSSGTRWYSVVVSPFRGARRGAVVSFSDIESRKHAEEEARQHRDELAHIARVETVGELTSSIAHEINQPLASIVTNANAGRRFLDREAPTAEVREVLSEIAAQGKRASDIIRGLRDMVRKGHVHRDVLHPNDLIRAVAKLLDGEAVARRISVKLALTGGLPDVMGDRIQLQQVVLNLMKNAFDAVSHEAPDLREVKIRSWSDDRLTVETAFSDTGPPVPEETFEKMFARFYTTKARGLGIGLSLSRSIIEAHGGRLWAEASRERRVTFRVSLPAAGKAGDASRAGRAGALQESKRMPRSIASSSAPSSKGL